LDAGQHLDSYPSLPLQGGTSHKLSKGWGRELPFKEVGRQSPPTSLEILFPLPDELCCEDAALIGEGARGRAGWIAAESS